MNCSGFHAGGWLMSWMDMLLTGVTYCYLMGRRGHARLTMLITQFYVQVIHILVHNLTMFS